MDVDTDTTTAAAPPAAASSSTTPEQGPAQTAPTKSSKRPAKRPRWRTDPPAPTPKPCPLASLPLELFAEVLSHTASPRDVLALARTSKQAFRVLVDNPVTLYIWKAARARCRPEPLPDPTSNYTEWGYAAFVFDGGVCEMCKARTRNAWTSWCLKLRLCDKPACRDEWRKQQTRMSVLTVNSRYSDILHWIPRAEKPEYNDILMQHITGSIVVRPSDWRDAVDEFNKAKLDSEAFKIYLRETQVRADHLPPILDHCRKLVKWQENRDASAKIMKEINDVVTAKFAQQSGWTVSQLLRAPAYDALYRGMTASLEQIKPEAFRCIKDLIEQQIIEQNTRRSHKETERARQQQRADVKQHYNRLLGVREEPSSSASPTSASPGSSAALPALAEFRHLPVMRVLQDAPADSKDMKNSKFIRDVLQRDLEQWREGARAGLAAVLGFGGWRAASKKRVHPVDRVTAWFRCRKCVRYAEGIKEARAKQGKKEMRPVEALDFKAACEHQCAHLNKRSRLRARWSADQFEVDQKVLEVVTQVLQDLKLNPEDDEANRVLRASSLWHFRCNVCPSRLTFDFTSLVRHCKRHPQASFTAIPSDGTTIEHGGARELQQGQTKAIMDRAAQKIYACRHCAEVRHKVQTKDITGGNQYRLEMKGKLYTFSGLQSHLTEKHRIAHVDDEDFSRKVEASEVGSIPAAAS